MTRRFSRRFACGPTAPDPHPIRASASIRTPRTEMVASAVLCVAVAPVVSHAVRDRRARHRVAHTIRCAASSPGRGDARHGAGSDGERSDPPVANALTRRDLLASFAVTTVATMTPVPSANASLQEPTLAEVTPNVSTASNVLTQLEQGTVSLFDKSTRSVVNVVDLTVLSGQAMKSGAVVPEGNGTGVVWDNDGHVVTNYHVLGAILSVTPENKRKNLECAKVTLQGADGRTKTFSATLVGVEKSKDLAVLKVNAPSEFLKPAEIGISKSVKVGQAVFAIGNPFGFDHTLTTGVISGLNRTIQSQAGSLISGGIQTDAAINPGNSGGALLDASGKLVGINTAIFTNTGSSAGVGFAIPIDLVQRVVPQLIENGSVALPGLNITVADPNVMKTLGVRSQGVLVQSIAAKSNAEKAGLLPTRRGMAGIVAGDVITTADGSKVATEGDLVAAVETRQVGEKITLTVKRGEGSDEVEELKIEVVLEPAEARR